jgi:hypothetical protein
MLRRLVPCIQQATASAKGALRSGVSPLQQHLQEQQQQLGFSSLPVIDVQALVSNGTASVSTRHYRTLSEFILCWAIHTTCGKLASRLQHLAEWYYCLSCAFWSHVQQLVVEAPVACYCSWTQPQHSCKVHGCMLTVNNNVDAAVILQNTGTGMVFGPVWARPPSDWRPGEGGGGVAWHPAKRGRNTRP